MNLNALKTNVMLSHSARWRSHPEIHARLTGHPLARAILDEHDRVYRRLSTQSKRRVDVDAALSKLSALGVHADGRHDRLARALYWALMSIAQITTDPQLAQACLLLIQILFPEGLSITQRSYEYEAGAIDAMKHRVTDEHKSLMASLTLGKDRLIDLYNAWVETGEELGRVAHEREVLTAENSRGGSNAEEVSGAVARQQWIATVHTFIDILDIIEIDAATRALILAPLEASIEAALLGKDLEADTDDTTDPTDDVSDEATDGSDEDDAALDDDSSVTAGDTLA